MAGKFSVVSTQPYTYQDATSRLVHGYRVFFKIIQFDEVHEVNVPNLDPLTVQAAVGPIIANREKLAQL